MDTNIYCNLYGLWKADVYRESESTYEGGGWRWQGLYEVSAQERLRCQESEEERIRRIIETWLNNHKEIEEGLYCT